MKKNYYLIILSFFLTATAFGQTENRFEEAVKNSLDKSNFFTNDDFFGVGKYDSLNIEEQFEFAETARRMRAISIAEEAYQRVVRLDTVKNGEIDYHAAIYWVGAMKKLQGDYRDALHYFEQYISNPPPVDNNFLELAKRDIDDCKFASIRTQKIDNQYEVTHLGTEVNTRYNDFAPLLVDNQLYFSSLKYQKAEKKIYPPRLYAKTLATDMSAEATPIGGFNKNDKTVSHFTFTEDKQKVYYTICDYVGKSRNIQCKIFSQVREDEHSWSEAEALPEHINQKGFTTTHPAVGYDETGKEILFFSSDRPNGKGQMDIWKTEIDEHGFYSKPTNYEVVNTPKNDLTPFYQQSTNTLYFSSDGRVGLGGFDIYTYADNEVKHGGYPLNSSFNDTHFTIDAGGDKGHFSSSREGCLRLNDHDMGCQDIFAVDFINIDLEILTFDDLTKKNLLGATVELFQMPDAFSKEKTKIGTPFFVDGRTNTIDHQFQFDGLVRDARYQLIGSKNGYISDTLNFNTRGITESITLSKELYLTPDIFEMDLSVLTFDEETRDPLTNCIVQLIDIETGERLIKDNITSNDFFFDIYSQRDYRLIASLVGYISDTLDFNTRDFAEADGITSITKRMYLTPGGLVQLDDLLPLTLYFDNDHPDPRTKLTTTDKNYEELFSAYYRKKGEFIAGYTKNIPAGDLEIETQKINNFFENDLKGNYDTLGVFSETLIKYLLRGNTAVISIRGSTSPLAATDYNTNLGDRRVDCLMNHFSTYRDGMLNRYIENGALVLEEISHGEKFAPGTISVNPKDRKNSVYSPEASKERKVQIVKITIGEKKEGE